MRYLLAFLLSGCIADTTLDTDPTTDTGPTTDARPDRQVDLAPPDAVTVDEGLPDTFARPDLSTVPDDAFVPAPDSARPPPDAAAVANCATACARLAECGQTDPHCLARCEAADDSRQWVGCVTDISCGRVDTCVLPELSCVGICEMAGDCGAECATMCAASTLAPSRDCIHVNTCGDALECLFGDDCVRRWRRASICEAERADIAFRACAHPTSLDFGEIVRRRHAACFDGAEECPDVRRCLTPPAPNEYSVHDYCETVRGCGLSDRDCITAYQFYRRNDDAFCAYEGVEQRCDSGRPRPGQECSFDGLVAGLNEAAVACGLDPPAPIGEPESRTIRRLGCVRAIDCDELEMCLASTRPATACATRCQNLVACGLSPDQATCIDACTRRFDWIRDPIEADCIAAAADCDAIAQCTVGNSAFCDLACARAEACGVQDARACADHCAFIGFQYPGHRFVHACYLGAPSCDEISGCPREYTGCLHACRLQGECAGRAPDDGTWLAECIINCDDADVPPCLAQHTSASCEDLAQCL